MGVLGDEPPVSVHAPFLEGRGRCWPVVGMIPSGPGDPLVITIAAVPIYEFECGECGERFEELTPAGTETAECPRCGVAGAERRLSTFGVTHQPTPSQQRRMEDRRGTNRGGARQRWQRSLDRARERRPPKPPGGGSA